VLLTDLEVSVTGALANCDLDNFCFTPLSTLPIIEVKDASNVAITNGGAASTTNNTDFGTTTCSTGGTVTKVFTIKNTGFVNLTLSGAPLAILGGTNQTQFSVITQPTTPIVSNGSTTVTVRYNPNVVGTHNATLTLTNNDATNSPFVINLKGISIAPSVAIAITAGSQTSCVGASVTFTATPTNGGATPMYQWKKGGTNIGSATNSTYTTTSLATGDIITCDMTTICATVTSNGITMTVPTTNTWTGITSTDWTTGSNWSCGTAPTNTSNIIIPTTTVTPTLLSNQTINSLSLIGSNKIILGNNNLTVNTITGGSGSSFIVTNGTGDLILKNVGTTATLFPVGPSTSVYAPATVTNNVVRDFNVRVGTTLTNVPNTSKVVILQWNITPSDLTGNSATLGLGWPSARQGNLFNPAGMVEVVHYNGTAWDMFRTAAVTGSDPYTATVTGVNVFSPFIVANATALSVELLDFKATPSVLGNNLTWITANEINNKGFQVERKQATGDSWETLGFVKGNGVASTYNFTDKTPYNVSYYRLKQMDNDSKETISKVVSVNKDKTKEKLKVYPNPVSNILIVETNQVGDYQVINLLGQQVMVGKSAQQIDVSALVQGAYLLKVGTEQVSFVKQ
jgi:Secretion system C-terminal sorting domain/Protein of unknown function (DUF1573)